MHLFHNIVARGVTSGRCDAQRRRALPLSLLEDFRCRAEDACVSAGAAGAPVPAFGCTFASAAGLRDCVAVANEEGVVAIYKADLKENTTRAIREWSAHDNAVFDVSWVPGGQCLVTASGDQTARLWDTLSAELLGTFKGHQCSLKSVAFSQQETAVFSTGGRDGNIMIWDTRCSKKDGFYRQVKQISGAHAKPASHARHTRKRRGMAPPVDSQQGVTVVLFRDEHTLISSGAVDGVIKVWDLRKNYTAYHQSPAPLQAYPYPGGCARKLGYSGLTLDSSGSSLFCNCTDDNIYMFNISGLRTSPVAVFRGHSNSSFYVKSCVSPDDQFLLSGSSDHHAYIWKVSSPSESPIMLQGHSQEVTSVTWCPSDFTKIVSCSDDNTVRFWSLNRNHDRDESLRREGAIIGWTQRLQSPSSEPMSAASLAACDVPASASSNHSAASRGPAHRVLKPVPQGSSSEHRAKRRLDSTGSGAEDEADGASEPPPEGKRSRVSQQKENDEPKRNNWLTLIRQSLTTPAVITSGHHHTPPVVVSPRLTRTVSSSPAHQASSSRPIKKISSYFAKKTQD